MYGDNFDDYYYYIDGVKHTLPVPYSTSGGIVYGKDEIFEALFAFSQHADLRYYKHSEYAARGCKLP